MVLRHTSSLVLEIGVISRIFLDIELSLIMLIIVEIIFRSWILLANANLTSLLILVLVAELGWKPSIRPRGNGHVRGILGGLLLLLVHLTRDIHFTLVSRVVRLLTVLIGRRF